MKEKKSRNGRFTAFVEGRGFYIVLALCLVAIGISAYVLFFTGEDAGQPDESLMQVSWAPAPVQSVAGSQGEDSQTVSGDGEDDLTTDPVAPVVELTNPPEPTPSPTEKPAEPSPTPTPSAGEDDEVSAKDPLYVWPVNGQVAVAFSSDELTYDKTMGDWRTHRGIDIEAALGSKVCAITDGTVKEVRQDDLMGTTVVVDHADGYQSIYSNLQAKPSVSAGQKVTCGEVLGAVGESALGEWGVVSHLHLAVLKDGKAVDPATVLG